MKKQIETIAAAVDTHIKASVQWYENLWEWAGEDNIARHGIAALISTASVLFLGVTALMTLVLVVGFIGETLAYFLKGTKPQNVMEFMIFGAVALVYFTGKAAKNKE